MDFNGNEKDPKEKIVIKAIGRRKPKLCHKF